MKSVILSSIWTFLCGLVPVFKESAVYRIFMKLYNAFSRGFKESTIMKCLKGGRWGENAESSLLYRIIYLPFAALNKIGRAVGGWADKQIKNSTILYLGREFTNSMLSANTRFLGVMAFAAISVHELLSRDFTLLAFALALGICVLLSAFNRNITGFLAGSEIVKLAQSLTGFEGIKWDFYREKGVSRGSMLILAAIIGAACGVLSVKSPILALALPVGIAGVCIVLQYPIVGVFSAVIAAPFVPTMVLAGICALTFCSAAIAGARRGSFRWRLDGVGSGLGFFLLFMLVSSLFSFAVVKSMMVWGMYLIFVGFYIVIINTVETKEQLYAILKAFAAAGLLVSLYGILQYLFGWRTDNSWIDEEMFESATMRVYSTMENPNVLGEYLLLLIPLAAVFMLRREAKKPERFFYTCVFGISLVCMVLTQSRGCWLGLMLTAAVFITFYNGKLWGFVPLALVILPFVIPDAMIDRLMSVGNLADSSTSYRVFIWRGTFEMLKDFWVGGIGMGEGAFRSVYPLYSYNGIIAPHSHNTFLQLTVEGGIGALAVFIAVMAAYIKRISKQYDSRDKGSIKSLATLAIAGGVLGFLLQSMFDYTFYNYRMMAMFFMVMALGTALEYTRGGEDNN